MRKLSGVTTQSGTVINGVPNVSTNVQGAVISGPYGANGFANSLETSVDSGIYKGTYNYALAINAAANNCICYNAPLDISTLTPSNHGITLLKRAGENNGNWQMIRNSAHTVLESNTKGFVITRMTSDPLKTADANHINKILSPQEGMMVYDLYEKCLKIYSDGAWSCFKTPTCP